jgi:hypothetical protein
MNDLDRLLAIAFAPAARAEPSEQEVAALLARISAPRRRRPRRVLALALAMLALSLGTALAVPQSRSALLDGLGRLGEFLSGGSLPGESAPNGASTRLNYLDLAEPGTVRVLVENQGERLIAFREETTNDPCLGLGRHIVECGDPEHWQARFEDPALGVLTTTQTTKPGLVAAWGVAADSVVSLEIRYRDGSTQTGKVGRNGFVVLAEAARAPTSLIAIDADGDHVATVDVRRLQWRF